MDVATSSVQNVERSDAAAFVALKRNKPFAFVRSPSQKAVHQAVSCLRKEASAMGA